jgi:hypothetical protein
MLISCQPCSALIEDPDQEAPELLVAHRSGRNLISRLDQVQAIRVYSFDDEDELDPTGAGFVPQKAVNLQGMVTGNAVDSRQDVVFNAMFLE